MILELCAIWQADRIGVLYRSAAIRVEARRRKFQRLPKNPASSLASIEDYGNACWRCPSARVPRRPSPAHFESFPARCRWRSKIASLCPYVIGTSDRHPSHLKVLMLLIQEPFRTIVLEQRWHWNIKFLSCRSLERGIIPPRRADCTDAPSPTRLCHVLKHRTVTDVTCTGCTHHQRSLLANPQCRPSISNQRYINA